MIPLNVIPSRAERVGDYLIWLESPALDSDAPKRLEYPDVLLIPCDWANAPRPLALGQAGGPTLAPHSRGGTFPCIAVVYDPINQDQPEPEPATCEVEVKTEPNGEWDTYAGSLNEGMLGRRVRLRYPHANNDEPHQALFTVEGQLVGIKHELLFKRATPSTHVVLSLRVNNKPRDWAMDPMDMITVMTP